MAKWLLGEWFLEQPIRGTFNLLVIGLVVMFPNAATQILLYGIFFNSTYIGRRQ